MTALYISFKSIKAKKLSAALSVLLVGFGTTIFTVLMLASTQIENKLSSNAKNIDLVVGAKGSPLQLILSSVYHIDFPTGNIPLKAANELANNPFVKRATPLALGDNYQGIRIVGTDSNFVAMYELKLQKGKFAGQKMEATLGAEVAKGKGLKIGDTFFGAHGLSDSKDPHKDHPYQVVGILAPQGNVCDQLILTSLASVWSSHGDEPHSHSETEEQDITSLLIQYRSPMSVAMFPQMVNQMTNLQSASPAVESTRLFALVGVGVETLQYFALLMMGIAALSVFVNLYNSLKEKKYDLAIMRTLGASKSKLFLIVWFEGVILTFVGAIIGIATGHLALQIIGHYQESEQAKLTGLVFEFGELYLLLASMAIGFLASLIPAWQAYKSNISNILAKN
ncbi:MAG: ABC transporter permease [Sphingobacteriaceae bacterium]|nr:ABC transporter permease [Sphingobacteriaceae bacterium]